MVIYEAIPSLTVQIWGLGFKLGRPSFVKSSYSYQDGRAQGQSSIHHLVWNVKIYQGVRLVSSFISMGFSMSMCKSTQLISISSIMEEHNCRGKSLEQYIGPQALSEDIDRSEEKRIVVKHSQLKSQRWGTSERLFEEELLLGYDEYNSQYVLHPLV